MILACITAQLPVPLDVLQDQLKYLFKVSGYLLILEMYTQCFKSHVKVHFTCKINILQILIFNGHESTWMMFQ